MTCVHPADYYVADGKQKRGCISFDKRSPVMKAFLDYISPPKPERRVDGAPAFYDDNRPIVRYTFDIEDE